MKIIGTQKFSSHMYIAYLTITSIAFGSLFATPQLLFAQGEANETFFETAVREAGQTEAAKPDSEQQHLLAQRRQQNQTGSRQHLLAQRSSQNQTEQQHLLSSTEQQNQTAAAAPPSSTEQQNQTAAGSTS